MGGKGGEGFPRRADSPASMTFFHTFDMQAKY
jgi:hypothetical protein